MAGTGDTPEGSPASPDDINSRLAEIAAELASEARFKEPSAAERARARMAAAKHPAAAPRRGGPLRGWRARRIAAKLRKPVHYPGGPAPVAAQPAPSRRARRAASRPVPDRGYADASGHPSVMRSGTAIAILLALLIGTSIGLRFAFQHDSGPGPSDLKPVTNGATASATAPSPIAPSATAPSATAASVAATFNPADPFAGTPAQAYADGAAGIVLPASRSYGPFSATEVSAALNTAQQLLVAGNLNPQTLSGGSPAISSLQGGPAGGRCDVNDGFVHPAFPGGPAENVKPNGPTIDPYDQRTPPPPPADAVQPRAPDRGVGDL